jgi:hypothetical protein
MDKDYYISGMRKKQPSKGGKVKSPANPPKGVEEKNRRNNMLINAKKNMDEKAQGYIISDERGMQMHYEPKPRFKHGGEAKCRGMGAAVKGGKFEGVF